MELARLAATTMVVAGLVDGRNYVSWIILITTPLFICLHPTRAFDRILGIVYGLLCPYALLSASYEPLFYLVLAAHLLSWPVADSTMESTKYRDKKSITSKDVTRAAFYVSFAIFH